MGAEQSINLPQIIRKGSNVPKNSQEWLSCKKFSKIPRFFEGNLPRRPSKFQGPSYQNQMPRSQNPNLNNPKGFSNLLSSNAKNNNGVMEE